MLQRDKKRLKKFICLSVFFAAVFAAFAAQYEIKLNPGDSLTITAPEAAPVPPPAVPPEPPPQPEPVPVPQPTPGATIGLGVNLPGPDDWNMGARAKVFVNVMKTARQIATNRWRVLTVTNNQAQELNWATSGSRQPKIAGTYLLSWDGGGTVTASGASIKNITSSNGVTTADIVVTSDSNDVDLQFSNNASKIVLLRPGYPRGTTQIVTNEFEEFCAPFKYIRFMDAMKTNWADANDAAERYKSLGADKKLDWAERAPDTESYNRAWGMSVEAAIAVANECDARAWIPIPWCATDDFLRGLSLYEKAHCKYPPVHEWGNELWNYAYGFYHSGLFRDEAKAYAGTPSLNPENSSGVNDYYRAARYAAKRTIDAAIIFQQDGTPAQFVLSSQFANPSFVADALNWALRVYPNPPSYYLAGIACAPYIGADTGSVDQILATLTSSIAARQANDSRLMNWRAIADAYGVGLYNYEAGIDMGQGTTNLTNRIAAAYDPRIEAVEKAYLDSCYFDAGLTSMMYFNGVCTRDKWGPAWGLTDDAVDLTQPMYVAAKKFTAQAAPTGGLTATFYKDTNFTTPLATDVVPLVDSRWQNWSTGGLYARKDVVSTEAKNGSIRYTGRYLGVGSIKVEYDATDSAVLTQTGDRIQIDYKADFGNGTAWVRLLADGKLVRQSELASN